MDTRYPTLIVIPSQRRTSTPKPEISIPCMREEKSSFPFPTSPHHHHHRRHHPIFVLLETCPKTPASFDQLHAHFLTSGLALHSYPFSLLLRLLPSLPSSSPHLSLPFAAALLRRSSTFLANTLTSSLAAAGHARLALSLYCHTFLLRTYSPKPNSHTFPSLLKACAADAPPGWGRALHAHVLKFLGNGADRFVHAALLAFYSRRGKVASCRHLFDQIPSPDLPSWNSILSAYARHCSETGDADSGVEALLLFQRLQLSPACRPNEITFVSLISGCGDLGFFSQGVWAHAYVRKYKLVMNCFVATALIDMYSKCGRLDLAEQVFASMPQKDTLCYNSMISGLAVHGNGNQALELFDRMISEAVQVDGITLVVVLNACAHCGLVDEGRNYFNRMKSDFRVEPKNEHYGCLVDILSRSGRLEEAEEIIKAMPMEPSIATHRSLLGACKIYNNVEMGERLIRHLIQLEPEHGGNYVLMSNMYAKIGRWDDVTKVRKIMKNNGVDKAPGSSLVEMDGSMHEFLTGDNRHPLSKEIYATLDEIATRLHDFGYRPSTKDVLFEVEEEDKEDALLYHSERLAIAFALLSSNSSTPIRIIKNLRVCNDCHLTLKLISQIYRRKIVMRDRSRFHHFEDGKCSCLDYW